MNFKTAILESVYNDKTKGAKLARAETHPRLWKALENAVAHRYERDTGEDAPKAGGDWSGLLDWLMANLPAILKLIMALFGA